MEIKQLNEELIAEEKVLKEYGDTMLEQYGEIPKDLFKKLVDMKMKRYKGETISERTLYDDIHENFSELSDEELYELVQSGFRKEDKTL